MAAWYDVLDRGDEATVAPAATSGAAGAAGTTGGKYALEDHRHAFTPAQDLAMGGYKLTGLGAGTAATDAVNLGQLTALASGIDWKASVRVATTAAGTLASSFENGDTVDGVVLATGDRILIKDQAAGAENGIYVVAASGAPTRATDADASDEVTGGMSMWVNEGTTNADTGWVLTTNDAITLGTTALVFTQFSGLGQITAGAALTKTGNQLDVAVDNSSIEVTADALNVKALGITNAMLAGSIALSKLATDPLARANHTGTQALATISDVTMTATNLNILDDGGDTTLHYHAADRARANHTGTQNLSTIGDVTISVANLNTLDDGGDTTLHYHAADRARSVHTGTQLAATISDFDTAVRVSRLDQMAAPQGTLDFSHASARLGLPKFVAYANAAALPTPAVGSFAFQTDTGRVRIYR